MTVCVLGFGSLWRHRTVTNPLDPRRYARAAYYNTTGVMVGDRLRSRSGIIGHVRFNGVGGFDPNHPTRMIGRVFECEEPCLWRDQNKILFKKLLPSHAEPERYLVVTRASEVGRLLVGEPGWSSEDVWVVALSEWHDQQEAMLLIADRGTIQTSVGRYGLNKPDTEPCRARLELQLGAEA